MRLLLVDDDPMFLEELSELLAGEGHAVATAPSALAALERLAAERFDVLLTDERMPAHSGSELLTVVRRRWPALLSIILTGQPHESTVREALDLGAFNYISKPFRFDWVRSTLDLAQQEITYRERLCASRPLAEARAELESVAAGSRALVAAEWPLMWPLGLAPRIGLARADGVAAEVRAALEGRPSPRVLLLAGASTLGQVGVRELLRVTGDLAAGVAPDGRLLVGVDREALTDAELIGLRWALTSGPDRPVPMGLAGPQRRAIVRALAEGDLSATAVADRTGVGGSDRIRFYLEYLLGGGLVQSRGGALTLTELGRSALHLLDEVERSGPRAPSGHLLFALRSDERESPPGP